MKKIITMLKDSVQLLKVNDSDLIQKSVQEQALSHRIAHYFENLLSNYSWYKKSPLTVDIEYNKNIDNTKVISQNICSSCCGYQCYIKEINYDIRKLKTTCRPDIVFHKRGTNNKNILVVEMKKEKKRDKYDFVKLSILTCPMNIYKYKIGVYIDIERDDETKNVFFQDGVKKDEEYLSLKKIEDILR